MRIVKQYAFIDLFAGLGGFHAALGKLGMKCVFASEINEDLRALYQENFRMECHGDITQIEAKKIPAHDILCAGFPCQPFSKAGKQKGLNEDGGKLIYEVIRILKCHQPSYFILENVPNIRTHDGRKTWETIKQKLLSCGYLLKEDIFSPHHFNIPHKRSRLFVVGYKKGLKEVSLEINKRDLDADIKAFLSGRSRKKGKALSDEQIECLDVWNGFIQSLPENKPLPKFPIWAMEFGATYPLEQKAPRYLSAKELGRYKGAFGKSLKGMSKGEQLANLPKYAIYDERSFPAWKVGYLKKNREFWQAHKRHIRHLLPKIRGFIPSWQKLEWNAGECERDIYQCLIQFRSSGVRAKSCDSIPSLVLTGTQIPIVGWEKRYLSLQEAQKLQGLDGLKKMPPPSKAFAALGNAVNTIVVVHIACHIFGIQSPQYLARKTVSVIQSKRTRYARTA